MPIQYDTPIGVGAENDWAVYGPLATDKLQAVSTDDGDSSIVYGTSGGRLTKQMFTFSPLLGVVDPVTELRVGTRTRLYAAGGGARSFHIYVNSVEDPTNYGPVLYASRPSYCTCEPNLGSVPVATVNGSHGMEMTAAGGPTNKMELWTTFFVRTTTFTFAAGNAGDFAYLIGSMVGGLIGSNLLLRDMSSLARVLTRVWKGGRSVRLLDHELEPAWRDWRAFRHPAYSVR